MLWEPCTLVASICWLLSHLHCTVDAGTPLRVMGTGQGDGGRWQSQQRCLMHAGLCISLLAHAGTWAVLPMPGDCIRVLGD
jgi:hypothetical protein